MKQKVIQLGGSFEATVTSEIATFNKPVTNLGMFYVKQIAEAMEELTEEESEWTLEYDCAPPKESLK